ncbi:hypothetical protein HPB49_008098 [Dermacentor silvarum]|uniref:Uncharacterized protein n=1 Tax=Dermacentor silvarum TaxID=543639 RepID=A0ACB8C8D3_DERSI|nr:hypothetical protein HPB49_008098 [Dermacentor silvarum]
MGSDLQLKTPDDEASYLKRTTDRRDQRDDAATESKNDPRHHEDSDSRRDDMERLRRKRATVRAVVTRIINDMTTLMQTEPTPSGELTDRRNLLKIKETMLTDLDNQVEEHVTNDNLEDELQSVGQYQESIVLAKSRAERILSALQTTTTHASHDDFHQAPVHVKLPKLDVPKFHGDPIKWPEFWDQFQSTVHQNRYLSNVDKLKYLRSYLMGKAESVISGLSTTNESYSTAIELLKEIFGQKTLIVNDHMRRLLNVLKVRFCEDFEGLQRLHEEVQTRVRSLHNLGVEEKENGVLLKPAIIQNLPQEMVLRYTQRILSSTNTGVTSDRLDEMSVLLDFLSLEVRSRE